MLVLLYLLFFHYFVNGNNENIESKRLLVDNSQVVDQRLHDLETKVQSLMAESNTQKSRIAEQDRIINGLNAQLSNLPGLIQLTKNENVF